MDDRDSEDVVWEDGGSSGAARDAGISSGRAPVNHRGGTPGNRGTVPPPPPGEPVSRIVGQGLVFLGPIVSIAGLLAIIRTGERSLFYAAMLPLGLGVWGAGLYLLRRGA